MKVISVKIFFFKLFFFIPIIVLIVFTNLLIDPANIFSNKYESQIVNILLNNKNVKLIKFNYNERRLQEKYINTLSNKKNVVVIGSSRAMLITANSVNSNSFFNNSVSGATIEDMLSIFNIYYGRNLIPDTLILGLDPSLLSPNIKPIRWVPLADYYDQMIYFLGEDYNPNYVMKIRYYLTTFSQLLYFSYFQSSVNFFINNNFSINTELDSNVETFQDCDDNYNIKRYDGSLCYNRKFRFREQTIINKEAMTANEDIIDNYWRSYGVDTKKMQIMEKFTSFLISNKITVIFLFTPYHPLRYNYLVKNKVYDGNVVECEKIFKEIAEKYNVKVTGSYNPDLCNLTDVDFYDPIHPKEIFYNNVINELKNKNKNKKN